MRQKFNELFSKYPLGIVFIFMTICLLPILILRDFTPTNELKYLSMADEAISGGHIFAFYNHGVPYADKPPLYFWLIMLCKLILGKHSMLALSMFSYIPALVIICVMDKWLRLENTSERAATALMLATSAMFIGTAVFIRMDMLMTMFIVLALYSFYKMYKGIGDRNRESILLPVWIFLALLAKGPVGILMPPLAIACFLIYKKEFKSIGKYLGGKTLGILAGLTALWLAGVWIDGGKEYIDNLLFHQTIDRAFNAFHHKRPFWYYFGVLGYLTAPYCLLLAGAFIASLFGKGEKRSDFEVLALCAIISVFVMLSSFSSKLSIYLLPIIPFMVCLFPALVRRTGWKSWMGWTIGIPAALLATVATAGIIIQTFFTDNQQIAGLLKEYSFVLDYGQLSIGLAFVLIGNIAAIVWLLQKKHWSMPIFMMASSILIAAYAFAPIVKKSNEYTAYGTVCKSLPSDTKIVTLFLKYTENMDVYLGRKVTEYYYDTKKFFGDDYYGAEGYEGMITLVAPTQKAIKEPAVNAILENNTVFYSGPYCIVTYDASDPLRQQGSMNNSENKEQAI